MSSCLQQAESWHDVKAMHSKSGEGGGPLPACRPGRMSSSARNLHRVSMKGACTPCLCLQPFWGHLHII